MNSTLLQTLTLLTALGCGLVAGVFFAFSNFVMKALARIPTPNGIAAMQSINITVITPLFMTALFGTGLACLALGILAILSWQTPGAPLTLAGCALYVVGNVFVTIGFNVPLNDQLAAVEPESDEGARVWARYLTRWTAWNHARTVTALAAAAALTLALSSAQP